jgi:hypothetical protein
MIYVFPQGNIVYDDSTVTDAQKAQAVAVESLPEPQTPQGKYAVIRANKTMETVYYEYKDIPKDPEVEQLKQVVADLTEFVVFGGAE